MTVTELLLAISENKVEALKLASIYRSEPFGSNYVHAMKLYDRYDFAEQIINEIIKEQNQPNHKS